MMERVSQGEIVIEKRGYSSAGAAEARVKPRAARTNTHRSFRGSMKGSLKGSMKGSLKRTPSLLFAAADSESDDLTSSGFSDHRPRRQCSFVNRGDVSAEIMDLRLLDSDHGSGSGTRRSPYELSVCSAGSFETLKTTDEKMGMFEVTLPAALKKAVTKTENADHSSSGNEGDDEKTKGAIDALAARRRFSMETIWSTSKRALPKSSNTPIPQDPIDPSVTKSPRKVSARRCAQATAIFVLLATFVVFPWLVIAIYFGVDDNDPSSLISSVTAKIPEMLEGLFDPRDENEVRHELVREPPFVSTGVNRRHLRVLEKDKELRMERVAKERQAKIKADKEKQRMVLEQRKRRVQKQKSLQGDEDKMIPRDSEVEPDTQIVKLKTFIY